MGGIKGRDSFHMRVRVHPFHVLRINIGQPLISVRCRESAKETVCEALRRSKFKFPGRQKVVVSSKWGFTKFEKDEYLARREAGTIIPDGCYVKELNGHGPFSTWVKHFGGGSE